MHWYSWKCIGVAYACEFPTIMHCSSMQQQAETDQLNILQMPTVAQLSKTAHSSPDAIDNEQPKKKNLTRVQQ